MYTYDMLTLYTKGPRFDMHMCRDSPIQKQMKQFLVNKDVLNSHDRFIEIQNLQTKLVTSYPDKYKHVIHGFTEYSVLDTVEYIRIVYQHKSRPLAPDDKVRIRNTIAFILNMKTPWSDDELEFFHHLLQTHDCI